jgi:hypothetical protein
MRLKFWQNQETPPQYFGTDNTKESNGAWLLALSTFLATLGLLVGLFWGGRWIYSKFTTEKPQQTATDQSSTTNLDIKSNDTAQEGNALTIVEDTAKKADDSAKASTDNKQTTPVVKPTTSGLINSGSTTTTEALPNTGGADL